VSHVGDGRLAGVKSLAIQLSMLKSTRQQRSPSRIWKNGRHRRGGRRKFHAGFPQLSVIHWSALGAWWGL